VWRKKEIGIVDVREILEAGKIPIAFKWKWFVKWLREVTNVRRMLIDRWEESRSPHLSLSLSLSLSLVVTLPLLFFSFFTIRLNDDFRQSLDGQHTLAQVRAIPCVTHMADTHTIPSSVVRFLCRARLRYNVYSFRNVIPKYFACSARFRLFVLQATKTSSAIARGRTVIATSIPFGPYSLWSRVAAIPFGKSRVHDDTDFVCDSARDFT